MLLLTTFPRAMCYLDGVTTPMGGTMEFVPAIGFVFAAYICFVLGFFRFLGMMRRKEEAVVRRVPHHA